MIQITPFSLPGMVLEENRNRSPSLSSMPRYLPRASCAVAARRSPCDPVVISIRFSRGISAASSGCTTLGKSLSTPVSMEASIIRRMARPNSTIERPARSPACASVLTRATLEAKVVAATMPEASEMSLVMLSPRSLSERPACGENTLVESHTSACTPSLEISAQRSGSKASPTMGLASSLKSPVWITRPAGLSITRPPDSGIECEMGTAPMVKGPSFVTSGQGEIVTTASGSWPCSSILRRAILAVKARA